MKRYTKSVNIRFEPYIEQQIDTIVKKDSRCIRENWSKSDVVRHFVRVGVKNWEKQMRNYY
jgi:Cdc6-like AAA superfamily ATPase